MIQYSDERPRIVVTTDVNSTTTPHNTIAELVWADGLFLVNKFRHRFLLSVAASPVLVHLLTQEERSCLIRPITVEEEKVQVIEDLVDLHKPSKHLLFHVGDTMGDFLAIKHTVELGA